MTPAELAAIDLWALGWAGEGSEEFAAVTRLVAAYRLNESTLEWTCVEWKEQRRVLEVKSARIAELLTMNESLCEKLAVCNDTIKTLAERCHGQSELLGKSAGRWAKIREEQMKNGNQDAPCGCHFPTVLDACLIVPLDESVTQGDLPAARCLCGKYYWSWNHGKYIPSLEPKVAK